MEFANKPLLFLLLIIPILIALYVWKYRKLYPTIQISSFDFAKKSKTSFREILVHVLFGLEMVAVALLIVALARPQSSEKNSTTNVEGIDIVMTMDVSGSMLAEDFKPNRLEAAKKVGAKFVDGRPNDRIGLVVFASESYTQCPMTTDHKVLNQLMSEIKTGIIEDGTAIGDGLSIAISRLKDSDAISKVIILLTDGVNNTGSIDPISAAEIAKMFGLRVYTIGVGTNGTAPYPVQDFFGNKRYQQVEVNIDEDMLRQIANMTGAQYFRATDNSSLDKIYSEIDKMEKSRIEVYEFERKTEEFFPFAAIALGLLALVFLMRTFVLRIFP
ncbi:MAG: VWA domain-containing protein [Bacteroidales bacterium]|nr:VWA domain-containing protein [Bacteroidales bacterium]MBR5651468.1 VWA domain-containing protein [Bacteroidales bacterium]MBR5720266.1 VWA domain-containing protein [Bacteroidales bacterium]